MSPSSDINKTCGCKETDSCNCDTRHPLERDGTSQAQRLLSALDPSYVAVDERSLSDLLVFALKYAKLLNYYDYSNTATNDWEIFLKRDISVIVSVVSQENISEKRRDFQNKYKAVAATGTILSFSNLFAAYVSILDKLNTWYLNSDERTLFHTELNVYFQSVFIEGYLKLKGVALGAVDSGLTGSFDALDALTFNDDWQEYIDAYEQDTNTSVFNGTTDAEKILNAAEWLKPVFEKFTSTLQVIIDRCPVYLEKSIEDFPYHKPHAGLFITFLHLFSYAQKHINGITERHLDFFYDEVLQLAQKEAVADKVHLIFELAQTVTDPFKVSVDTLLKAGKDATGMPLFYGTDDDIIVNKAKVAGFQNLYIDNSKNSNSQIVTAIHASSVANSSDGIGGELDKTVPQWKAFGSSQQGIAESDHTMPEARLGFAIASKQLLLTEGLRTIIVEISFNGSMSLAGTGITEAELQKAENYQFMLTGAKAWMEIENVPLTIKNGYGIDVTKQSVIVSPSPTGAENFTSVTFELTLPAEFAAIANYSSKIHKGTYDTSSPVLTVILPNYQPDTSKNYWQNLYAVYSKAVVKKMAVNVVAEGMQNITLHNDFAKIDPTKPFQIFGQQPVLGSTFYAGSEEIFFKSLNKLNLNITWHGAPDNFYTHYENYASEVPTIPTNTSFKANGKILEKKKWGLNTYSGVLDDLQLFAAYDDSGNPVIGGKTPVSLSLSFGSGTGRASDTDIFDEEIKNATRGFIKLELSGTDFLHDAFPIALAYQALQDPPKLPKQPYTPTVKKLTVDFASNQVLETEYDQFFHLQPFGEQEIDLIPSEGDTSTYRYLMPQFVRINDVNEDNIENAGERTKQKGMLFIALEKLDPQQSVSMLVQVVENSSNPKVEPPDINWAYLRDNEWVQLSRQQVFSDTSNGFLTSGIIELDIPEDATNDNTILPSGYHWLRASVDADPTGETDPASALCNLLDIKAQAIQASFRDTNNDSQYLANPLVASTITKLDTPLPEIKSVSQPFSSFGGKVKEEGNDFYRRVSERLRHKGRAITMWDYERLVLENYPSIYKVKCISHTLDKVGANSCYVELAPGNVCMIVVSNLRNQNQVDLLRPSTGINTREEIKDFLNKRSSKFAKISVIDPLYQSIQVKTKVQYLPEYQKDKGYYDKVLIDDIKKFLSPWAYDEGADIVFGGKMHASYIINFIEERSYVDYLTDFKMYLLDDDGNALAATEVLAAANAKSILVSADTHLINP